MEMSSPCPFQAGASVKAGDLLVQMDVSSEKAQLQSAEAGVVLARLNLQRSKELLAKNTIAQSQLDSDDAAFKQSVSQRDNIQATIDKKTLRAPFAGRLGIRLVNVGQTLKAGDPIVSLQALDPIFADFYLPQQEISSLGNGLTVKVSCDAYPSQPFEGTLTAINPDVDAATRNIRVQATFANAKEQLRPGMYVDVKVVLPGAEDVVAIPATAVLYAPFGDSVFVVEDQKNAETGEVQKIARQKFVRLGTKRGDFVAVTSGIEAGTVIVTSGVFKLRNGEAIDIDNTLVPDAKLHPTPDNS